MKWSRVTWQSTTSATWWLSMQSSERWQCILQQRWLQDAPVGLASACFAPTLSSMAYHRKFRVARMVTQGGRKGVAVHRDRGILVAFKPSGESGWDLDSRRADAQARGCAPCEVYALHVVSTDVTQM